MRLLLTVVDGSGPGADVRDVTVDAPAEARTSDLSRALGGGVLHLLGVPLDPDQPLRLGPVRHGSVVHLGPGATLTAASPTGDGCWEVRVESGPGAGWMCRLGPGEYQLGAGPSCDVLLPQAPTMLTLLVRRSGVEVRAALAPSAPRDHTGSRPAHPVLVDDGTHPGGPVTDDGGSPEVHLDGRGLGTLTRWPPGRSLVLGPLLVGLRAVTPPDQVPVPDPAGATLRHRAAPRLRPPPGPTRFTLPTAPRVPEQTPWPWLMLLVPLGLGVGLYLLTHAWQTLLFLAMAPVLAVGGVVTGRRTGRRRHRRELAAHSTETARVRRAALVATRAATAERRARSPDPALLLDLATRGGSRLWERRREDPDALVVRLGTAHQLAPVRLGDPDRPGDRGDRQWLVPDLPVTLDLAHVGVVGVAGADRHRIAEWLLVQLACLLAPSALRVGALVEDPARWGWLHWVPHAARGDDLPGALVGADDVRTLVARRTDPPPTSRPQVVLVVEGAAPDDLLEAASSAGIALVCLAAREQDLPPLCRAVLAPGPDPGTLVLRRHDESDLPGIRADLVAPGWAPVVARALAPLRDAGPDDVRLPDSCTLLEAAGLVADPGAVRARWAERRTAAVIGLGTGGRRVSIDLARDGPHALVAGTTGSGKSELLRTLVVSLAATYPPDALSLVLVDYKGGAAFRGCAGLPHTVGLVTDLDAHLTARALDSLSAEVRRREAVLAASGATDLAEHQRLRAEAGGAGGPHPGLARLVIVVDEFATLVADLPDFVSGLVDIARRGRSLGLHLVLATQRPSGVVTADLRANTSLRIALRVTDPGDSTDVVDTAGAARISDATPGRGLLRRGPQVPEAFQTALVSRAAGGGHEIVVGPFPPRHPVRTPDPSATTELDTLVGAIDEAARAMRMPVPAAPWLPPLPDRLGLDEVATAFPEIGAAGGRPVLAYGLLDEPARQRRAPAVLDLSAGRHLAVVGASGSGRTQVLRTLAAAVAARSDPADVHVHAVDCGGGGLLSLSALPHVGVVVARDQTQRMERLLDRLATLVRERAGRLAGAGHPDVHTQRAARPDDPLPWVLVLLDRWEGFCRVYEDLDGGRLVQAWQHLLQEAGGVGITIVMTGDRTLAVGRMCTLFDDTLMLRTSDPGDLATVGVPRSRAPRTLPPGRGFRSPSGTACQVALPGGLPGGPSGEPSDEQVPGPARPEHPARRAFRLDDLPTSITREQAPSPQVGLLLGVGGDRLAGRGLTPAAYGPGFLVAGPRRSGRSTALLALAAAGLDEGRTVLGVTARASPLTSYAGLVTVGAHRAAEVADTLGDVPDDGSLVLVDDLDLLDPDGPAATAVSTYLSRIRDRDALLVASGSPTELAALYRGPAVALRRGGCGLLLAPRSPGDADLLGLRLPRSALAARTPPGRGHLVHDGTSEPVQVVLVGLSRPP